MIFFTAQDFNLDLPDGHRFPGHKYRLLEEKLVRDGTLAPDQLRESPVASDGVILSVHTEKYLRSLEDGTIERAAMRRIGFPWSEQIPRRGRRTVGGQLAAARQALRVGLSGQLAGGTHHAHPDFGSGYCIFNDQAVAATVLLSEGAVDRIAIVDLDVHQGDGNAAVLADNPNVLILDVFGEKNFPFRKVPSDIDVPLPDNSEDGLFLRAIDERLQDIWAFKPDLVLYQAGVDPLKEDKLGRLDISFEGLRARDEMVLEGCRRRGIPCSMAIGGGYSMPIEHTVTAYAGTYEVAKDVYGW
ncbi:histone deacetylase family protein [Parvularcula lutaonensis]|uniref:Histone deacetylase n=1 Tax=Parvularcula lutaonensis TaxID=491923 RepID=A0ABV7M9F7_9PROT|nr:histone deacetylase [Parvularcula lutaonensis]GGY46403.1 histone deacetylase [Parvularcula lutaonensis]